VPEVRDRPAVVAFALAAWAGRELGAVAGLPGV